MATKPMRIARHVYLRTQQRRLRHVKGILIRNLTLSNTYLNDPLCISVFFTVHAPQSPDKVLFKSDPIQDSYNPTWETIQFAAHNLGHYGTLSSFRLRVWVTCDQMGRKGAEEEEECSVVFEKLVELSDLAYLGLMVNKDGSSYPPNSVVVNMYEGLYSRPEVGGIPCAPRVIHTLTDWLPPQSLLEVPKKEVVDSYLQPALTSILGYQEELNKLRREKSLERSKVNQYRQLERMFFEKRSEREKLVTRLKLLRAQVEELQSPQKEESDQLESITKTNDESERDLEARQTDLRKKWADLSIATKKFTRKKDKMLQLKRSRQLRQRHMVYELSGTFLIKERDETFTICNVILPNADQLEQPSRVEQLGVALGYVAHLVHHLGKILFIPLLYPIKPQGSKSVICDLTSEETLIDNIKEFPLFAKGSEKALFQYAVFLLNKDIAQVRQHCGYGTSKSMFKQTLPNLKFLLDRLTRDIRAMKRGWHPTSLRSDMTSMTSSYVNLDTTSVASGSGIGSLQSPKSLSSFSSPQTSSLSLSPLSVTQTQQFVQRGTTVSPKTKSDLAESEHRSSSSLESNFKTMDNQENDPVDSVEDDAETPLADLTTEHNPTQPQSNKQIRDPPYFPTIPEDTLSSGEEESVVLKHQNESTDEPTNNRPTFSTTPSVVEEIAPTDEGGLTFNPPPLASSIEDSTVEGAIPDGEISSSVSHMGNMEETLKSAVHMTHVLLGHAQPEDIHVEPAPTMCSNEIQSTQALLDLTTASFTKTRAEGESQDAEGELQDAVEDPKENGQHEVIEHPLPQGPPLIPDSFDLSPLSGRLSSRDNEIGGEYSSDQPQSRSRALAYSAFTTDNAYIKTGMATPHRVGSLHTKKDKGSRLSPVIHELGANDENGQSLADFIDRPSDIKRSPPNRWKSGPNRVDSRVPF